MLETLKSLPVRGAWVEINWFPSPNASFTRRSPCGERGLKLAACARHLRRHRSLPVRGAWVEIVPKGTGFPGTARRSPCGERGLKFMHPVEGCGFESRSPCGERGLKSSGAGSGVLPLVSLPVRGAWVEISPAGEASSGRCTSLPVRGAWVEILSPVL